MNDRVDPVSRGQLAALFREQTATGSQDVIANLRSGDMRCQANAKRNNE